MEDNFTPAKRKQTTAPQPSEDESTPMTSEDEMTTEQLWAKWEKDARERKLTTQEEWQLGKNRKALDEARKTDPTIGYVFYGEPLPLCQEAVKKLYELFKDDLRLR